MSFLCFHMHFSSLWEKGILNYYSYIMLNEYFFFVFPYHDKNQKIVFIIICHIIRRMFIIFCYFRTALHMYTYTRRACSVQYMLCDISFPPQSSPSKLLCIYYAICSIYDPKKYLARPLTILHPYKIFNLGWIITQIEIPFWKKSDLAWAWARSRRVNLLI